MIVHWVKASNGKEYPIRFVEGVSHQLATEEGIPLNMLGKFFGSMSDWPIGRLYRYYQLAFRSAGKAENKPFPEMSREDFIEWFCDEPEMAEHVVKIMMGSNPDQDDTAVQKKRTVKAKR